MILAAGGAFVVWGAARADREMRTDLLDRARLVAATINVERIRALTASAADVTSSDYRRLKDQLADIRAADPKCRFVYLMGRKPSGEVFFYADSEPAGSEEESPPGQIYEDATATCAQVLATGVPDTEGPVADRWGTWVSALVPLIDPKSGTVLAVLGIDIDARDWKRDVAGRAALPAGLGLLLTMGLLTSVLAGMRVFGSPKPVTRCVLPFLILVFLAVCSGAAAFLWQQYYRRVFDETARLHDVVEGELRTAMGQYARSLGMAARTIATDPRVREDLIAGNAEHLLADWRGLFDTLHREQSLTRFCFLDAHRVCLVQAHQPQERGHTIDRFTVLQAERTGTPAWGMELGPPGNLTLCRVDPVFDGQRLAGYIELGTDMEHVLRSVHVDPRVRLAVILSKDSLPRETWEAGMRGWGREADWDRLPHGVMVFASQGRPLDALARLADRALLDDQDHSAKDRDVADGGRKWRVRVSPLADASGKKVGRLLVMNDVTGLKAALHRDLALGGTLLALVLAALFSLSFVILRRIDARIRAQQEELRQSEERFAQLARQSRTFIWEVDAEGLYTFVSCVVKDVLGYSPEELVGKLRFFDLHPEEGREAFKAAAFEMFARKETFRDLINPARCKNGEICWLSTNGIPLLNPDGTLRGYRGSDADVTERERVRQALDESERRFMDVLYASDDAILLIGHNTFIDCNEATARMLGYPTRAEFLQTHPSELSPPKQPDGRDSFEKAEEMMRLAFERGFHRFEWIHRRANGEEFPVEVSLTPIFHKGRSLLYCVWRDITEIKRAEEAIKASEAELRAITDSAQDAIIRIDACGLIRFWNPAAERILGYSAAEAIGQNLHALVAPERFHAAHAAAFPEFQRTGRGAAVGKTVELTARRKDGEEIPVALSLSALSFHDEWHAVGILRDVTAQKRAEAELLNANRRLLEATARANEMAAQAAAANAAKSEFLANMSHEIRTPITAILGFAEAAMEGCPGQCGFGAGEHREHLEAVVRNGNHLLTVINDILDLSKVEAGELTVERIVCSPFQVIAEAESLIRVQSVNKGLALQIAYEGPIPETILSDPTRLRQILVNLLGNAIKFTEAGQVSLTTRLVGLPEGAPALEFDVVDTGVGMSEEQTAWIFQPFKQADSSTTRRFGGTGLGLTISKRLAQALGGDVQLVESKPGVGSRFRFTVATGPLDGVRMIENPMQAHRLKLESPAGRASETERLEGLHILLAEDAPDNQRLITLLLKKAGAEVVVVENGQQAVEAALAGTHGKHGSDAPQPFDLILMDMQMPVMDGYTAVTTLRERGYTGPIIALTAHAMALEREKCLKAGCDDYATKPVNRKKLFEAIRCQVNKSPARKGSAGLTKPDDSAHALVSELAGDEDLADIIEQYVNELPQKVAAIEAALCGCDLHALAVMTHQLKGSAGGYGFPMISRSAAELEAAIKAGEDLQRLQQRFQSLAQLCHRARAKTCCQSA